jgi:hypothetical protein
MNEEWNSGISPREFVERLGFAGAALGLSATSLAHGTGIVAHQSALKDGELLKIPQYSM